MASAPWSETDRAYLEALAGRRDWIGDALARFPSRTEAAIRCMMQKVRLDLGVANTHEPDSAWMRDARQASDALLSALNATGVRP